MNALRDAIIASLKSDAALTASLGGPHAYDGVVRGAPYPHVALGECETAPWDTQTSRGQEHVLTLHVWSRASSAKEARAILDLLDEWSREARPAPQGVRCVSFRNIFWSALNAPEAGLYHGVMRLRIVTEPSA